MRLLTVALCVACIGCGKGNGGAAGSASAAGSSAAEEADEPSPKKTWNVGDVVQVKRDDNKWHEAEIVTAGATYKVMFTFADQVEDNVDPTRIRAEKWSKNAHIEAHVGDAWKRATVVSRHPDGGYDVTLDDGGETKTLAAADVRGERKPKSAPHASASSNNGGGGPAPCTGTAFVKRCGGVCTDTSVDNNNCGQCGDRCNPGKHCDGHGFCREPNGDL